MKTGTNCLISNILWKTWWCFGRETFFLPDDHSSPRRFKWTNHQSRLTKQNRIGDDIVDQYATLNPKCLSNHLTGWPPPEHIWKWGHEGMRQKFDFFLGNQFVICSRRWWTIKSCGLVAVVAALARFLFVLQHHVDHVDHVRNVLHDGSMATDRIFQLQSSTKTGH